MTRQEYWENTEKNHHEYYLQFGDIFKDFVESNFTKEYLLNRHKRDKNINNIKTTWFTEFNRQTEINFYKLIDRQKKIDPEYTGGISLAFGTCAIKAYMRHWIGVK